jgi:V/A-type H+-transporting ATPase subunit A
LEDWYANSGSEWPRLREEALSLLRDEEELREIASLVGAEILGDKQRIIFEVAKMIKEYFLLQNAFHPVDMYCPITKTYQMLQLILHFATRAKQAVELGVPLAKLLALNVREDLGRMRIVRSEEFDEVHTRIFKKIDEQFNAIISQTKAEELA